MSPLSPREIVEAVRRIPRGAGGGQSLLRDALRGDRLALLLVRAHRWRQQVVRSRPTDLLVERLWRKWWRG